MLMSSHGLERNRHRLGDIWGDSQVVGAGATRAVRGLCKVPANGGLGSAVPVDLDLQVLLPVGCNFLPYSSLACVGVSHDAHEP